MLDPVKQRIVADHTAITGRHDEPDIYGEPPGDPGLLGPDSISWEIHGDIASLAIAGPAAIVMEIMHPSVMAGVHDMSSYREDPFRRARNTAGYVVTTTFASTARAESEIARVRRMHERVNGVRPDGEPYEAIDPDLIGWVHTCIPWAVMAAFDRYCRPLSAEERDRYLAEQAIIGRLGGAGDIPETYADLQDYIGRFRPHLAVNEQTRSFIEFLVTAPFGPKLPEPLARRLKLLTVQGSMTLLPAWTGELTGLRTGGPLDRTAAEVSLQLNVRALRWAFGTPAYKALALARVRGEAAPTVTRDALTAAS
ncbi:MAG: oxygenase MpaB family protein [Baekduiaceae bacterium]